MPGPHCLSSVNVAVVKPPWRRNSKIVVRFGIARSGMTISTLIVYDGKRNPSIVVCQSIYDVDEGERKEFDRIAFSIDTILQNRKNGYNYQFNELFLKALRPAFVVWDTRTDKTWIEGAPYLPAPKHSQ